MLFILQEQDCMSSGNDSVSIVLDIEALDLCSIPRTHLKKPGMGMRACNLTVKEMVETGESWGSLKNLSS